jgi:hypothetical protein
MQQPRQLPRSSKAAARLHYWNGCQVRVLRRYQTIVGAEHSVCSQASCAAAQACNHCRSSQLPVLDYRQHQPRGPCNLELRLNPPQGRIPVGLPRPVVVVVLLWWWHSVDQGVALCSKMQDIAPCGATGAHLACVLRPILHPFPRPLYRIALQRQERLLEVKPGRLAARTPASLGCAGHNGAKRQQLS